MATLAVIIPAAGSGTRMKSEVPKPYLQIGGRTILEWTVSRFLQSTNIRQVIVATGAGYIEEANRLLSSSSLSSRKALHIIEGGSDRQESVEKALEFVDEVDLVAVHDAVRPFVTGSQIAECCKTAEKYGGAVLGIPARDTIKECDGDGFVRSTPDRSRLWQCQTPQIFRFQILKKAFRYANDTGFRGTDDASIVEHMGGVVRMVQGDASNIKITYPQDMIFAKILIEQENKR